jgi:hypothetical protein
MIEMVAAEVFDPGVCDNGLRAAGRDLCGAAAVADGADLTGAGEFQQRIAAEPTPRRCLPSLRSLRV